jgi:hypothetical protein
MRVQEGERKTNRHANRKRIAIGTQFGRRGLAAKKAIIAIVIMPFFGASLRK